MQLAPSSYGRSVKASVKVSVGRDGLRVGPMVPHTPLARGSARVSVGDASDRCYGPNGNPQNEFQPDQVNAWSQQCGKGAQRRPLGTTRAQVTAGSPGTFAFATVVPFKPHWLDIDDSIASDFSISSFLFGMNQIIVGGAVNASAFNSRSGKDFRDVFDACVIYPSVPAQLVVTNNSLTDLYFLATLWGVALL